MAHRTGAQKGNGVRIRISWAGGEIYGQLDDTPSSRAVYEMPPHTAEAHTWGQEVYFSLPVQTTLDARPQQVVPQGTICFWVQGSSLALPYGPTPISTGKECRLVTAVNVLGRLEGDPHVLASVQEGAPITVEPVE